MRFETVNPATEDVIASYETMTREKVLSIAEKAHRAFGEWRALGVTGRATLFKHLARALRRHRRRYARTITLEMGKPITDSLKEIEKCAWTAEFLAEKAEEWLGEEAVEADGRSHTIHYEPLGTILSIMPWNFPFWQALRSAIPTLLAGNVSILKHSNQVPKCALSIEECFRDAGFPEDVFRTVIADHESVGDLVQSDFVQGVSLTGSTAAGQRIGEMAGRQLKKVVLELGGSDPFIVLEDADVDLAARSAVLARTINGGQSCIAAKRLIVLDEVAGPFLERFVEHLKRLVVGDPMKEETQVGPLVNQAGLDEMMDVVEDALGKGASLVTGGKRLDRKGFFFEPTLLTEVEPDMKVVSGEVFGPVAPVIRVRDEEEAIQVANSTEFGLGGSVWTRDLDRGVGVARRLQAGTLFVNGITKSDPRMPFGGIKMSGVGRELSKFGMREFVNIQGLNVYDHR